MAIIAEDATTWSPATVIPTSTGAQASAFRPEVVVADSTA
jgi:hypothetical protein